MHPGILFDTELASRIVGHDRPNLAAMVERFVGVELEKGHGHEDWSRTPLPKSWQDYAALDVEYLHELAEALTEVLDAQGKLHWAFEEFAHLIAVYSKTPYPEKTWRDMKGLASVRDQSGLQVARELWHAREEISEQRDIAPGRLLPNRALLAIALAEPDSPHGLTRAIGGKGMPSRDVRRWLGVVERALSADPATWPRRRDPRENGTPSKSGWERHYPESWQMLQLCREDIAASAEDLDIRPDILLTPAILRETVWNAPDKAPAWDTHQAATALEKAGARPWQIQITAPILAAAHAEMLDLV